MGMVGGAVLATIAVAQIRVCAAERALDENVMSARDAGRLWQAIGDVLSMTRQGANKSFHVACGVMRVYVTAR